MRTVVPYWETDGTKLTRLTLLPVEMPMQGNRSAIGLPRRSDNPEIAEYIAAMSAPYGTVIRRESDGTLSCHW